jgi:16S rRNA (cytosine967-C5)-methyltransferase
VDRRVLNAREFAVGALVRVEDGAFSNVVVPASLRTSGLAGRDRAFATDLVYGTLREQRRLDALLAPAVDRPIADLDPPVRAALRTGAYQLVHGAPPHAAVGETVAATPRRARGFVNAVLRRVAGSGPPWPEPADLATRLSYPDWIVDERRALVGDGPPLESVLAAGNRPAGVTLRPNPRRANGDAVAAELAGSGAAVARGALVPEAVLVRRAGDPAVLPVVAEGRATPQDQASQAVIGIVDAGPGERVLDVAAAPGGKATGLAERIGDAGLVVAADLDGGRLRLVARAAERLGLANVSLLRSDGRRLPLRPRTVDAALVDAPCSGLGVLRRRPEARWRTRRESVPVLAELQRELLREAAGVVRPGGRLVYSVCTLTATETIGVAEWAVGALDGFVPAARPPAPWRPHGAGALLLPDAADSDGMFVLTLQRVRAGGGRVAG